MEDNELLPLDNLITEAEPPLPDIISPDDIESGAEQIENVTPSITIAEEGEGGEQEGEREEVEGEEVAGAKSTRGKSVDFREF